MITSSMLSAIRCRRRSLLTQLCFQYRVEAFLVGTVVNQNGFQLSIRAMSDRIIPGPQSPQEQRFKPSAQQSVGVDADLQIRPSRLYLHVVEGGVPSIGDAVSGAD